MLKNKFEHLLYYKKNKEAILEVKQDKVYKHGEMIGSFMVRGNGIVSSSTLDGSIRLSGYQPRLYLKFYSDFELTFEFMKTKTSTIPYSGCVIGRGLEGHNGNNTNLVNTYYSRLRNDGFIDFEKEAFHPGSSVKFSSKLKLLPYTWYTVKHIVRKNRWQTFLMNNDEVFEKVLDYTDEKGFPLTNDNFIIFRATNDEVYYKNIHVNQIILEPVPY